MMRKLAVCIVVSALCLFMVMNCFADENEIGILTQFSVSEDELNENIQESFFQAVPFSSFRYFESFSSLFTALETGTIGAIETDEYVSGYLLSHTDGLARYIPDGIPQYEVDSVTEDENSQSGWQGSLTFTQFAASEAAAVNPYTSTQNKTNDQSSTPMHIGYSGPTAYATVTQDYIFVPGRL